MIIDLLRESILQNIGPLKSAPKGWNKRCCFLCHTRGHGKDNRNRFGIQFNETSIAINCFNCGFTAGYKENEELSNNFEFFLRQLNIDEKFIRYIKFEIFKIKNKIESIRDGDSQEKKEDKFMSLFQKWKPIELPEDSLSISIWLKNNLEDKNFLNVANYALKRKISNLDDFYWTPIKEHNLNKRLIIPYYYRNKIVGYTCRLCYDSDNKMIPKYYQQSPTDFVYNLDHQQDWMRKYVIVTEGVLDAWTTDGVGILGEMNQTKADIINRLQKKVIVSPDRDKKGWDLIDIAIKNNWEVSFPKWTNDIKDASKAAEKYGRLLTVNSIIESAISGKEKIKIRWDIEQNERNRKRQ